MRHLAIDHMASGLGDSEPLHVSYRLMRLSDGSSHSILNTDAGRTGQFKRLVVMAAHRIAQDLTGFIFEAYALCLGNTNARPRARYALAFEDTKAVVYDFCESRAGDNARVFLGDRRGSVVCDDFSGYKQLMTQGVTALGCLTYAQPIFFDLHASNKSQIAQSALEQIGWIYDIEREVKEFTPDERR